MKGLIDPLDPVGSAFLLVLMSGILAVFLAACIGFCYCLYRTLRMKPMAEEELEQIFVDALNKSHKEWVARGWIDPKVLEVRQ